MKKIIALTILCVPMLPAAAHAENHGENYVGLAVSTLTAGPSSTGAAVMLGRRYNENLAAEVAYADSGALSAAPERTTTFSAAAVGFVPITANFEGYGRLGYASAKTKDAAGISARHGDITYGFGVEYRVNEHYSVGLGWDRVRVGDNVDIPRANENSYALAVVRNF